MGHPRPKPRRLADKLKHIRLTLGLSQTEMLQQLGLEESMHYSRISEYEKGSREPSLITLLQYARVAGMHLENIVDDHADLPAKLPGSVQFPSAQPTRRSRKPGR